LVERETSRQREREGRPKIQPEVGLKKKLKKVLVAKIGPSA
jgi:hypothetical protein